MPETTIPPGLHELHDRQREAQEAADDEPSECTEIIERTGEVCGRERPCRFHDEEG